MVRYNLATNTEEWYGYVIRSYKYRKSKTNIAFLLGLVLKVTIPMLRKGYQKPNSVTKLTCNNHCVSGESLLDNKYLL